MAGNKLKAIALYLMVVPIFVLIGVAEGIYFGWKRGVADVKERAPKETKP